MSETPGVHFKSGVLTKGSQKSLFWRAVTKRKRPTITRKLHPEEQLQSTIVEYLRVVCPQCFVFAIRNEANRGIVGHLIALQMGMEPGLQDLCLLNHNGRSWEPFFIEVKTPKGIYTDAQENMQVRMTKLGIHHAGVRSIADVRSALDYWKIERRDNVPTI